MKKIITLVISSLVMLTLASAKDLAHLKVLYVGSERTADYVSFLKENVGTVETRDRATFNPADAARFDVVLLDWPQGLVELSKLKCPLGRREDWSRPTVLIGSASLQVAVAWQLEGGIGCTCLSPQAYNFREHELFQRPLKVDLKKTTRIPTPPDFTGEIKEPSIDIVALVGDIKAHWRAGWCSYSATFDEDPEVEFFCSGVNEKTPTAAGIWRQGNLLHFGFEQSPAEMNETGQKLLLNAIAYISHFTEDRPIAIKPSAFLGQVSRTRRGVLGDLQKPEIGEGRLVNDLAGDLWTKILAMKPEQRQEWAKANTKFLHPAADRKMEIDEDLVALGVAFDAPEFFDLAIGGLKTGGPAGERSNRLLKRYVQAGTKDPSAAGWTAWYRENQPFLFAADEGEYLWYVDALAKKRGIPTKDLRGPKRADQSVLTAAR